MSSKIRVLSDHTINQIAAGEVIENPASVVKELVENALDAGSTKIAIEIVGGGFLSIKIIDNGEGMSSDDAFLAFERHATSKLTTLEDLLHISSMGFRGEALASIAAVSKVDLETCNGLSATKVGCYGGKIVYQGPIARSQGTTVTVQSLFYNVPARKKFQKTAQSSTVEIVKTTIKLALAHKNVSFKLFSQDKLLLQTEGKKEKVVEEVLGDLFAKNIHEIFLEEEGHQIEGVISSPTTVRQNRTAQYLFINKRPIYSPFIAKVVKEAYGTRIGSHDYPLFVLWLKLPQKHIDVNVHPQKSEVRFQYEEMIETILKKAVRNALTKGEGFDFEEISFVSHFAPKTTFSGVKEEKKESPPVKVDVDKEVFLPLKEEKSVHLLGLIDHHAIIRVEDSEKSEYFFLNLFFASCRIQFEEILERLEGKRSEMQTLLFPKTIEFTKEESMIIEPNLDFFAKMGLGMRPFGKHCFIVDAIAPFFNIEDAHQLVSLFIEDLKLNKTNEEIARRALEYPRRKKYLESEVKPIFFQLLKTDDAYHAPNGKKTMVLLDEKMLERLYE